jgi:uncharacterized protein YcnI
MPSSLLYGRVIAAGALLGTAVLVGLAAPASGHVRVTSPDATAGGYGTLAFKVPSESDTASTVKLSITLPADTPFPSVSTAVHPGWKVTRSEAKLAKPTKVGDFTISKAVHTVTFTAAPGNGIPPGEFDTFSLSVGPLPTRTDETLSFPTTQNYSDGSVVRWNQPTPASGVEPDHPAPTLTVAPAGSATAADASGVTVADTHDDAARWLAGGALVLGAIALAVSLLRLRRPTDTRA